MGSSTLIRSPSEVYGEILRESGICASQGKYIEGKQFAGQLHEAGVSGTKEIMRMLAKIVSYGQHDTIVSGVQFLRRDAKSRKSETLHSLEKVQYFYNPWKELMHGEKPLDHFHPQGVAAYEKALAMFAKDPKEGMKMMQQIHGAFAQLPKALQEAYMEEIQADPCSINVYLSQPILLKAIEDPNRLMLEGKMMMATEPVKR